MCGIVSVLARPLDRPVPALDALGPAVEGATAAVEGEGVPAADALRPAVEAMEVAVHEIRGFAGMLALLQGDAAALEAPVRALQEAAGRFETRLDASAHTLRAAEVERLNGLLIRLKDAAFRLERDRLANVGRIRALGPEARGTDHRRALYQMNVALNALDRLEVRGRDSAGLHLLVQGAGDAPPRELAEEAARRNTVGDFKDGAVRRATDVTGRPVWSFVYKVAAEVGELGDNVRRIRGSIAADRLLHALLERPGARADVLGHTRWASVGVVSEENAHPLNQEQERPGELPYTVAVLNGDVDNFQRLIEEEDLTLSPAITTDAKVIPAVVSALIGRGESPVEAFRKAVSRMDGSVAIGAQTALAPGKVLLALRGSGQAIYVGLGTDLFLVASEPYGIVEEASRYVRLDGETPADPERPESRGQILVLDAEGAGALDGIERWSYEGEALPLTEDDVSTIVLTTRDVDRGHHRHFLRKELNEAPDSFRKTLRGRLFETEGRLRVRLGEESLPESVVARCREGAIRRIRVIGQGTAAVAGRGIALLLQEALKDAPVRIEALPATELSGFHLEDDLSGDLVVAISQSGTTTDTNRTVDLIRTRGATVLAIVNRRHSDLTERADGVLYTSDGRDVEMSVASTKAFYSQIAAGALLGEALAEAFGREDPARRQRVLAALRDLPEKMRRVLATEGSIAAAAQDTAPYRRHWALVGNGPNTVAAAEIRIKLSELCYKSIACDATEDKKHIDLSSEPLILVCAAGLQGGNALDVAKEVEIFAAHKACPIVIASEGSGPWPSAAHVLEVPDAGPELTFVLATMVGHLYGYHAAMAIDGLALPLREVRGLIEATASKDAEPEGLFARLRGRLLPAFHGFHKDLADGRYDGALDAREATRLSLAFRYAAGVVPLEFFADDYGRVGTPAAAVEELIGALTTGIEVLTRPIDAIKHQAKTVTVGISRTDEALMAVPLVRAVLASGATMQRLAYPDLRVLQAIDPALAEVPGWTRYAIREEDGEKRISVVGRGGISEKMPSRTDKDRALRGTKNTVAREKQALIAVGRSDGRPIVLVPERESGECVGIVLLHAVFRDDLDANTIRAVLSGYRSRYQKIRDAVVETGGALRDEDLVRIGILDLLTEPVLVAADRLTGARA